MISDRQLEANRRNAQHSTGPQTPEGRAAVRNNAVTHALTAQNAVLPDESKEEFDAFFAAFEAEYQPAGPTETLLLTQIVMDAWRLQRIRSMETAFFELAMSDCSKSFAEEYKDTTPHKFHAHVFRQDTWNADVLSRLGRYESRIHRNFYRALHELQRLQALRAGASPPPPGPTNSASSSGPVPPSPAPATANTTPDLSCTQANPAPATEANVKTNPFSQSDTHPTPRNLQKPGSQFPVFIREFYSPGLSSSPAAGAFLNIPETTRDAMRRLPLQRVTRLSNQPGRNVQA
jgi:hypothetical protein